MPSFRLAALGAGFLQIRRVSLGATVLAITSSGAMPEFRAPNNRNEIVLGAPKQNATTLAGILAPECILGGVRPQIAQAIVHLERSR